MIFILELENVNLQQALEMSGYTWAIAIVMLVLIVLIDRLILKSIDKKQKFYQFSLLFLAPYTLVTSCLWFYYFTLVLCLPFFILQVYLTWRHYKIDPRNKLNKLFIALIFITLIVSFGAASFFGMLN